MFQDWQSLKTLIGKAGKDALKRLIFERDLEQIHISDAKYAETLITQFKKEDIEIISKAAAVFFSWVILRSNLCTNLFLLS